MPGPVATPPATTQLVAGNSFTVLLQANGALLSCGTNVAGQLGDNTTTDRLTFTQEVVQGSWLAVAAGDRHALARPSAAYLVASTGANEGGQLGDGSTTSARRYNHATVALPVRGAAGLLPALSLYPNPTAGAARLSGTAPGAAIRVLDSVGRLAATATADAAGTAALHRPAGLYLVQTPAGALRLSVQ